MRTENNPSSPKPRLVVRDGRVIRVTPDLGDYLPKGVMRRVTDAEGVVTIPDSGTGRYSVPNAVRRSKNA